MLATGVKGNYESDSCRPRMVFAYVDSAHAAQCRRSFRRNGWEVHLVAKVSGVHRLVEEVTPSALVIDIALLDSAGLQEWRRWIKERSSLTVILLVPARTSESRRLQEAYLASGVLTKDEAAESRGEALLAQTLASAV